MIIGIGYRAHSGKDSIGKILVYRYGFYRIAFADILKDATSVLCYGLVLRSVRQPEFKEGITPFGLTGGQLLQRVGTALREAVPGIFIEASHLTQMGLTYPDLVITDVRHLDEAKAIKDLGGILIEVRRYVPQDDHVSETEGAKIKWDHVIENNGSLVDLEAKVVALMASLGRSPLPFGVASDSPQALSVPAS